jgi:hypothetical protein
VKFDGRVPGVYLVGLVCVWRVFGGISGGIGENWRELAEIEIGFGVKFG